MFPVADGDTGDNMALTMRYVLEELDRLEREEKDPPRPEIVRLVARAALMGARGNSGVILSQFIRGAAEKLVTPPGRLIDPELIKAGPRRRAASRANASVRDPQPGTMLTVAERMAEAVEERLDHWREHHRLDQEATDEEQNALLAEMMATALFAGEEAVRHTPEQLAVLAEHGVVDAGALGLVVLVRGYIAGLAGEQVQLPEIPHYAPARTHDVHHADLTYRWCTNFIVTGEGARRRLVRPAARGARRLGPRRRRPVDDQGPRPHRRLRGGEGALRRRRRDRPGGHRRHARAGRRARGAARRRAARRSSRSPAATG